MSDLGFKQYRVRAHDNIARIEVPAEDIEKAASAEIREKIVEELTELGFDYITLDLAGFKSGSMNKSINKEREG